MPVLYTAARVGESVGIRKQTRNHRRALAPILKILEGGQNKRCGKCKLYNIVILKKNNHLKYYNILL